MQLEQLPQFARSQAHLKALATMAPQLEALSLHPHAEISPDSTNVAIAANSTFEHRITIPAGAFLWAISGSSEQPEGFRLQIVDSATNKGMFSSSAFFGHVTGQGYPAGLVDCAGAAVQIKQPLYLLPKPHVIAPPAMLRVQITNLSALVSKCQTMLHFFNPPLPGEPRNQWNELCDAELDLAMRAIRGANATGGSSTTTSQQTVSDWSGDAMKQPAVNLPFNVSAVGDNIVIAGTPGLRIAIHQFSLYAAADNTIRLLDGSQDLQGPLTNFAAGAGYFLAYQEEPHFVLSPGDSFVINLANATAVGGFVKYRLFEQWGN
jgi:hypothetical protein